MAIYKGKKDIVWRLRDFLDPDHDAMSMLEEAASEIEDLRKQVDSLEGRLDATMTYIADGVLQDVKPSP